MSPALPTLRRPIPLRGGAGFALVLIVLAAALLGVLAPTVSAASKLPTFTGSSTITAGTVTVRWTAQSSRPSTVQVRVASTIGSKSAVRTATARYRLGHVAVTIKGGAALTPAAITFRARLCARSHGKRRCGRWSKATHPTAQAAGGPAPVSSTTPSPAPVPVPAGGGPTIGSCPVLPTTSAFNQDVSALPVDPNSGVYIRAIGMDGHVHPDFGAADLGQGPGGFGIPYVVVPSSQALVPIDFQLYGDESDPGPYPVPRDAPVEGGPNAGGDRHVLVVREGECKLYELGNAYPQRDGSWQASGGAAWDLNTGARTSGSHPGWTSADAAGLPILPGLARYDEVAAGAIRHALRFTVAATQQAYIAPASHWTGSSHDTSLPPMGLRLRMRAGYDTSGLHGQSLVIATALKRYGMIVADNGSPWYISGAPSTSWNDDDLNQLKAVPGSAFEVVQTGATIVRP